MSRNPTQEEVFAIIAESVLYGNLGLFIGAGFSKGVLQHHIPIPVLNWSELLQAICCELHLNYEEFYKAGQSYPDIASAICIAVAHSSDGKLTVDQAVLRVKETAARLTAWYPSKEQRDFFMPLILNLQPAWIITTNYDLVIETILVGKSVALAPNQPLTSPTGLVPVYHLHGIKYDPSTIIITREDYIALFRPNEYRQSRLAITLKESTTLFLGYGLGDTNVLTALDWSRNVYDRLVMPKSTEMIQVLYSPNPKPEPYRGENNMVFLETANLGEFLTLLGNACTTAKAEQIEQEKGLASFLKMFEEQPVQVIGMFIDEEGFRRQTISVLKKHDTALITGFMTFLSATIDETWKRAEPPLAFHAYNEQLNLLLDVLTAFELRNMPPALFEYLATTLERLASYIGMGRGDSHASYRTWHRRKAELSQPTVNELRNHAARRTYFRTLTLLEGLWQTPVVDMNKKETL